MSNFVSLVTLVQETTPSVITALRSNFPEAARLLSTARPMGGADLDTMPSTLGDGQDRNIPVQPAANNTRMATLALAEAGIKAIRSQVNTLLQHVLGRMKLAARIKLAGAVAASLSGLVTAALAFSTEGGKQGATLAAALFSFVGGIVAILADQVVRTPSGLLIASTEEHGKIVAMRLDIERIGFRLSREVATPLTTQELGDIMKKLDDHAIEILRYQSS